MVVSPASPEEIYRKGRTVLFKELPIDNSAVIFDVDKTLLELDVDYVGSMVIKSFRLKPIPPLIALWNLARKMQYKCYIITARTDMEGTVQHLQAVGVYGWEAIIVRNNESISPWVSKAEARDYIYRRHHVAINVGDSLWDIGRENSTITAAGIQPDNEPSASFLVDVNMLP